VDRLAYNGDVVAFKNGRFGGVNVSHRDINQPLLSGPFRGIKNIFTMSAGKQRTSARVTKAEYEALAAFRYNLRQFLHFSESAAETAGVTPRQHQALLAVKGFPGRDSVTIGELAEQLQIAHHSAVGLVDRLAAQKLIIREAGSEDRRQVYVRLSARGAEVLQKLTNAHKDELRRLASVFSDLNRTF
jgi:DNA-binding MarR family transcriptional regulator